MEAEAFILGANRSTRAFEAFARGGGYNLAVLNSTPECNCFVTSGVGSGADPGAGPDVPAMCSNASASMHSPVRDWWTGYPDTPMPLDEGSPQRPAIERHERRLRTQSMRAAMRLRQDRLRAAMELLYDRSAMNRGSSLEEAAPHS